MGLMVEIYRSEYDTKLNVFYRKKGVTVINIEGPFEPSEDSPAAKLAKNSLGNWIIVPADDYDENKLGPQMFGGTYGATSDSRFSRATKTYSAIPIHDRRETWELYYELSR